MTIRTKRLLLALVLAAGALWDSLCLLGALPFFWFPASAVLVGGYCVIAVFVPLLFRAFLRGGEVSAPRREQTKQEKRLSAVTLSLAAAWLVTLAACLAAPL